MGTYRYSIVRYVPDPIRGERLNVGVVVAGDDPPWLSSLFLPQSKTGRLRQLARARGDFAFLRDLADEMGAQQQPQLFRGSWNLEALERAAVEWANTIQFSPPRAAQHDDPNVLLRTLFARYVAHPAPPRQQARGRRWLRTHVHQTLIDNLTDLKPEAEVESAIAQAVSVRGGLDEHVVDLVLFNGGPRTYVQTLSFEAIDEYGVKRDVDVLKWMIDDLRHAERRVPLTVVTLGGGELLERAEKIYERLDAAVVHEQDLRPWAESTARELAAVL